MHRLCLQTGLRFAFVCGLFHQPLVAFAEEIPPAAVRKVDFTKDVLPVLSTKCFSCHGPNKQESSLRVDRRAQLLRGGESGEPAIVVGKSASSHLIQLVAGVDPDRVMPPEGTPITRTQIAVLRAWIDQGAQMPAAFNGSERLTTKQWSFQPLRRVPAPLDDAANNPIDAFVRQKLKQVGLQPSPKADRVTLIRRLYLVMLGLPPSPADVESFVADRHPLAWERLVDRVLASPHLGERWARHWLDVIRFGETQGFETNRERPNAFHFRDYVIDAINTDKPYDQFVREQIAGDSMGVDVANGYLVAGPHDIVKSPDINLTLMQRQDELSDLINTTGTTFLGLTLGCARCHNHKFDPITQRDFYAVQAVFAGVSHGDRALPISAAAQQRIAEIGQRTGELEKQLQPFLMKLARPRLRPPVNTKLNVEQIQSTDARFVRFTIEATNNGSQPCIDELELWSGKKNVALAATGAKATCSSALPGYPIHKLEHINDGRYGNGRSWISNEAGQGWVQIELPQVTKIDRIEWARDREQRFRDRLATQYRIEFAVEPNKWKTVASSADRMPPGTAGPKAPVYDFAKATAEDRAQGRRWLEEVKRLQAERTALSTPRQVYAGRYSQPGPTHRLYRGEPLAKREIVGPDALEVIGHLEKASRAVVNQPAAQKVATQTPAVPQTVAPNSALGLPINAPEQVRRVRFAEWIASPNNPLTARVIVNRLWQHQFGVGLVATPSDFGANGAPPSHPELLDWLASELIRANWPLKHIHRLILTSRTFQQSNRPHVKALAVDRNARLLWRFPPRRLEAEAIRDCVVAVSGALDRRMRGPGFSGFEVQLENVRHFFPKKSYGPQDWRRMIYMTKVRQEQDSVFGAFDCPDASQVMPKRSRSTTPLQALNLFNSTFMLQQAGLFASRLEREANAPIDRVRLAFELTCGRPPEPPEAEAALELARDHGLTALCRALLNANEFLIVP